MSLGEKDVDAQHKAGCTCDQVSSCSHCYLQKSASPPPNVVVVALIRACAKQNDVPKGQNLHAHALKYGLVAANIFIGNTLVSMYAKWGAFAKAMQVFDELFVPNVVSWTALIAGYAQRDLGHQALKCFNKMKRLGLSPEVQTFTCALKACGSVRATKQGEKIHQEITQRGLLQTNVRLGNAVVDMYAKCGEFEKAQQMLDKLLFRNEICWNGLITGFLQHGHDGKALECFDRMQHEGISPSSVTFACALKACGGIVAVEKGDELHAEIMRRETLAKNSVIGTALVDMYIKCGAITKAQKVFDGLSVRNVVSWTALIAGYAEDGRLDHIFGAFNKMVNENVKPNLVTYIVVLNACRHLGLVDEAQSYFESLSTSYGIVPTFKHYICMINLLGLTGFVDNALLVIMKSPLSDRLPAWSALLSTCQRLGNVKLAREAFEQSVLVHENRKLL